MTDQQTTTTIPEPADGRRVVVDTGSLLNPLRLYWRNDAEAGRWDSLPDERWFDDENSDPLGWDEVCRNAKAVFLVDERMLSGACDAALVPMGTAPVEPCVHPLGHEGLHQTKRGASWADPDDDQG